MDNKQKYVIIGYSKEVCPNDYVGHNNEYEKECEVATFDTEKMAKDYIKNSRLKQPKYNVWAGGELPFKKRSLLYGCNYAEVHEYYPYDPPPHNPEI